MSDDSFEVAGSPVEVTPTTPTIFTRVAWAGWDDHAYRGHELFADLAGNTSFAGLLAIAVNGKRLDADACAMLDDLAVCMAVAEPRIWLLKLARVVASYGSAMAGYCAGHAMIDGGVLGGWVTQECAQMLVDFSHEVGDRIDDTTYVQSLAQALVNRTPRLAGFGVPFRSKDERVVALARCVEARGRTRLRYWRLLDAVASEVLAKRGLAVNIGGGAAAVALDLGFAPVEVAPIAMAITSNAFLSNALEGAELKSESLVRLPIDLVRYVGKPPRSVVR